MLKKILFFAALIVAIGSVGGNTIATHAQTAPATTATAVSSLTPAQISALKQELQVAQATLINLEMQNGLPTPADAGTPTTVAQGATAVATPATTGLSATQISAFKATLGALSATLTQLSDSVVSNSTLTPSQETAIAATLNGMQSTLVAMANEIANGGATPSSAPIAAKSAPTSAPVAVNNAPATTVTSSAPTAAAVQTQPQAQSETQTTSANKTVPQTAQASSLWSFTKAHWPTIVIVLLVIAILAILFWPEKKEPVRTVSTSTAGSGKPKSAPTQTVASSQQSRAASVSENTATPHPATPVANAVAAPAQK